MTGKRSRRVRIACWMSLGAVAALLGPAACIYPPYTFDEDVATGGGTSTSGSTGGTAMTSSSTGNPTATSSAAGSGMSVTSSSTGSSGGNGQGGAAASSSTGASSASTTGSGGTGTGEDCLNNVDDDGDGDADCSDSECTAGHICVEGVPFGWSGFMTLFEGLPMQEPACPAAFPTNSPYKGNHTLITDPATCSACNCSSPTGQTCNLPDSFTIRNKPCGQIATFLGTITVPTNWTGACYGNGLYYPGGQTNCNGDCNQSISSPSSATASGGTCSPQGGTPTLPPTSWAVLGKACGNAPSGIGCGAGMVCQPRPALPFLPGLCISRGGDNACPAGSFSQKHVFYDSVNDSRGCTSCTCAAPTGSMCSATVTFYSETNNCTTPVGNVPTGGCGNLTGNPNVGARSASNIMFSGGTCFASGGSPTGMASPNNPTTFCCVP